MKRVSVDEVEPEAVEGDADRRGLTERVRTTHVAINHYRLEPGEQSAGLHAHADQEEAFFVVDGEAVFETTDGDVAVGPGEAIRFAPDEFHSGAIATDSPATVLALGAPWDTEDVRIPLPCLECGNADRHPRITDDGETPILVCPACGTETEAICPECGGDGMRAELADDGETPVGICVDCGADAAS